MIEFVLSEWKMHSQPSFTRPFPSVPSVTEVWTRTRFGYGFSNQRVRRLFGKCFMTAMGLVQRFSLHDRFKDGSTIIRNDNGAFGKRATSTTRVVDQTSSNFGRTTADVKNWRQTIFVSTGMCREGGTFCSLVSSVYLASLSSDRQ